MSEPKTCSTRERIIEEVDKHFEAKEQMTGPEVMRHFEKALMLNVLDQKWKDHLASMDYLRQGIGLRGYAQKNPKQEYKREAFEMFGEMIEQVKHDTISILSRIRVQSEEDLAEMVLWLADPERSGFVNGSVLDLSGGQHMGALPG